MGEWRTISGERGHLTSTFELWMAAENFERFETLGIEHDTWCVYVERQYNASIRPCFDYGALLLRTFLRTALPDSSTRRIYHFKGRKKTKDVTENAK